MGGIFLLKTIFIKSGYQKRNYCFVNKRKKEVIDICKVHASYTIMSSILKNPLIDIRKPYSIGNLLSCEAIDMRYDLFKNSLLEEF